MEFSVVQDASVEYIKDNSKPVKLQQDVEFSNKDNDSKKSEQDPNNKIESEINESNENTAKKCADSKVVAEARQAELCEQESGEPVICSLATPPQPNHPYHHYQHRVGDSDAPEAPQINHNAETEQEESAMVETIASNTGGEEENTRYKVCISGIHCRVTYSHPKCLTDILDVVYVDKTNQYVILDNKGITLWQGKANKSKGYRILNYAQFEHGTYTHLIYGKGQHIFFALRADFNVEVLNREFKQTCKINGKMKSVTFMIYNSTSSELFTGGVDGTKVWKYEQTSKLAWNNDNELCNSELNLIREMPTVGGSWVRKVTLCESCDHLYCCSTIDVHVYNCSTGSSLFSVIRAHVLPITGCIYSVEQQLFLTSSEDNTLKVWTISGSTAGVDGVGCLIHTFQGHSKGITALTLHDQSTAMTSSKDGTVRLWNLNTLEPLYSTTLSCSSIKWMDVVRSSDVNHSRMFICTSRELSVCSVNMVAGFWSVVRSPVKKIKRTMICYGKSKASGLGFRKCIIVVGDDNSVRVIRRRGGRAISTILPPPVLSPMRHVRAVALNPDSKVIYLLLDETIIWLYTIRTEPACRIAVWDVASIQQEISKYYEPQTKTGISFEKRYSTLESQQYTAYECMTMTYLNSQITSLIGQEQCQASCSRYGFLVVGLESGRILFLDPLVKNKLYFQLFADKDPIISVDHEIHNKSLITWSDKGDYHLLRFWSLPTLNLISESLVLNDISCFSRLGCKLFTGHTDGSVIMCDLVMMEPSTMEKGNHEFIKPDYKKIETPRSIDHSSQVVDMDILPNNGILCSASSDGMIKLWSKNKTLLSEIHIGHSLTTICFVNTLGSILIGYHNHVFRIDHHKIFHSIDEDEEMEMSDEDEVFSESDNGSEDEKYEVNMDNYLVPVNRFMDKYFIEGKDRAPIIENLTDVLINDDCSMVLGSEISSKYEPANTETYMSDRESLYSYSNDFKRHWSKNNSNNNQYDMPLFGESPGPTPCPSTPSTLMTPSSAFCSSNEFSDSCDDSGDEYSDTLDSVLHSKLKRRGSNSSSNYSYRSGYRTGLSKYKIDSQALIRAASSTSRSRTGSATSSTVSKDRRASQAISSVATSMTPSMTNKKQMKTERKLPKRGIATPNQLMLPNSGSGGAYGEESLDGTGHRRERRQSRLARPAISSTKQLHLAVNSTSAFNHLNVGRSSSRRKSELSNRSRSASDERRRLEDQRKTKLTLDPKYMEEFMKSKLAAETVKSEPSNRKIKSAAKNRTYDYESRARVVKPSQPLKPQPIVSADESDQLFQRLYSGKTKRCQSAGYRIPSARPNTPAEVLSRAWKDNIDFEDVEGLSTRELLEREFLKALRVYQLGFDLENSGIYSKDAMLFDCNWQEREIERYHLLQLQRQLRSLTVVERRENADHIKKSKQRSLIGHKACCPISDDVKEQLSEQELEEQRIIEDSRRASSATFINMLQKSQKLRLDLSSIAKEKQDHNKQIQVARSTNAAPFRCESYDYKNTKRNTLYNQCLNNLKQKSSSSIPSKCSNYILIQCNKTTNKNYMEASPLEEKLIHKRFPNMSRQWLTN